MIERLDRFSDVAGGYARFRPHYPESLYKYILSFVQGRHLAWDVGTGNGQVAQVLAQSFNQVIATDISASQIAHAFQAHNIEYRVCPAEESGLPSASINLITVAQAVHWFNLGLFTKEVKRVAVQDAILAIWGYGMLKAESRVDAIIGYLYEDILKGFWDPQRVFVERRYADLQFPFVEIACPDFEIEHIYDAEGILGFLRTWSAVNKYLQTHKRDPVLEIEDQLREACEGRQIDCYIPVFLRMWQVTSEDANVDHKESS